MANHESALKRMRQAEKRRLRNRLAVGQMRTAIKKYRSLVAERKHEEATAALPAVYAVIDRTEKKGVIHANTASRYKARLARLLAGLAKS